MATTTDKKPKPSRFWHSELKYRDIKRMAVERGMPFPEVISSDFYGLVSYIDSDRALVKPNKALILEFDLWLEKILLERGADYLVKPSLRLSYIASQEDKENKEPKKEKIKKEKVGPKERDENNLFSGTKKSYTVKLAKQGLPLERVKKRVLKKFPEASPKSIVIWYRKALNIKHEAKVKVKVEKDKKVFTGEERVEMKRRAVERKSQRNESRKKAKERTEDYRKTVKNRKGGKGKKKKESNF